MCTICCYATTNSSSSSSRVRVYSSLCFVIALPSLSMYGWQKRGLFYRRRNLLYVLILFSCCENVTTGIPFVRVHEFELTRAAVVCEKVNYKLFLYLSSLQGVIFDMFDIHRTDLWWTITLKYYINILYVIRQNILWVSVKCCSAPGKDFLMIIDCKETKTNLSHLSLRFLSLTVVHFSHPTHFFSVAK